MFEGEESMIAAISEDPMSFKVSVSVSVVGLTYQLSLVNSLSYHKMRRSTI